MPGQDAIAVRGFLHPHRAELVEPLGEVTCELLGHVLHDDHAGAVGGQPLQNLEDGFGSARRRADRQHDVGHAPQRGRERGDAPGHIDRHVDTRLAGGRSGAGARVGRGCGAVGGPGTRSAIARAWTGEGRGLDLRNELGPEQPDAALKVDLRLVDEVDRTQLEGLERGLAPPLRQRGAHDHRHRVGAHQPGEKLEAIHAGHLDVQRQDVGAKALDHLPGLDWIGRRADDLQPRVGRQHLPEHLPHQRRVVDHQHARLAHAIFRATGMALSLSLAWPLIASR
jgi:hypothetical protein